MRVDCSSTFFNDTLDLMIFLKLGCAAFQISAVQMNCLILNEIDGVRFNVDVCSCVAGALLGGDLGNSNGACPSPVRK